MTDAANAALDPDIAAWLERAEARSTADPYRAAAEAGDPNGPRFADIGTGVAVALTSVDEGFFNRAIGLGVGAPTSEAEIDAVIAFYRDTGRTIAVVQPAPGIDPPEAVDWLAARDLIAGRNWAKLWHRLDRLPEPWTDLRIERIDLAGGAGFAAVISAAFELPPELGSVAIAPIGRAGWTHYVGYDGDEPVSAAAMHVADGVAWLGFGATLESHRGRGGQSAMFSHRLRDAADLGARLAITETGEDLPEEPNPSYRNMLRAGFRHAYLRRNWIWRASPEGPAD